MFGFGRKTRDIITLFHKQSNPSSVRVHNALKMLSAQASETATGDQASDHSAHQKLQRTEFDLEVTEADPTPDQLSIVLDYVGPSRIGEFVKGASTKDEAMKRLKEFTKPTIVDWATGRATTSESESEIIKLLNKGQGHD